MLLYYAKGTCSLSVRIVINTLNIPCDFEAVNLKTHQTARGQDFYTINPKGAVATLVLENGQLLSENAILMQYLADQSEIGTTLLPKSGIERYHVLEWVNYVSTELHKGCAPLNAAISEEIKETIFKPQLHKKLDYIEKVLTKTPYLTGSNLSIADCYLYVVLRWLPGLGIQRERYAKVEDFFQRMHHLPSVQKSLQQEGLN